MKSNLTSFARSCEKFARKRKKDSKEVASLHSIIRSFSFISLSSFEIFRICLHLLSGMSSYTLRTRSEKYTKQICTKDLPIPFKIFQIAQIDHFAFPCSGFSHNTVRLQKLLRRKPNASRHATSRTNRLCDTIYKHIIFSLANNN